MTFDSIRHFAKTQTIRAAHTFKVRFDAVPDDKLLWSPMESVKPALYIGAHIAIANFGQSKILRGETPPKRTQEEFFSWFESEEKKFSDRKAVNEAFEKNLALLLSAFDDLTEAMLSLPVATPLGRQMTIKDFMGIPAIHHALHAGQIDQLQLMWGDKNFYS